MELQNYSKKQIAELLNSIAVKIKKEYDFNDYELSIEKLKEISKLLFDMCFKYHRTEDDINIFFDLLHEGKYGTLYKMPSDLVSKFYKYINDNNNGKYWDEEAQRWRPKLAI